MFTRGGSLVANFESLDRAAGRQAAFEKMGNGTDGKSGPGALVLSGISLPERTLTVRDVFPSVSVEFAFDGMPAQARRMLSVCFGSRRW